MRDPYDIDFKEKTESLQAELEALLQSKGLEVENFVCWPITQQVQHHQGCFVEINGEWQQRILVKKKPHQLLKICIWIRSYNNTKEGGEPYCLSADMPVDVDIHKYDKWAVCDNEHSALIHTVFYKNYESTLSDCVQIMLCHNLSQKRIEKFGYANELNMRNNKVNVHRIYGSYGNTFRMFDPDLAIQVTQNGQRYLREALGQFNI